MCGAATAKARLPTIVCKTRQVFALLASLAKYMVAHKRQPSSTTSPHDVWKKLCGVFRGDLWRQKARVPGLSCGVVCVILRLAVSVELRLVTDTDGQTQGHG